MDLSYNDLGPEEGKAIASGIRDSSSITSLSLGDNNLGDEGVETISIGVKESKSLATLDLRECSQLRALPEGIPPHIIPPSAVLAIWA